MDHMKPLDINGTRFGRLVAVEPTPLRSGGKIVWRCVCDCGGEALAAINHLRDGRRVSCGCAKLAGQQIRKKGGRHGHCSNGRSTRTYRIWGGMLTRCRDPNSPPFKWYGGRGITVCERWLSFDNFLTDMGEAPPGLSIDRINVNEGYNPDNCRWATDIEQHRNRRDNVFIEHNGVRATISEWAERTGLSRGTIRDRLLTGAATDAVLDPRLKTKSEAAAAANRVRWGERA